MLFFKKTLTLLFVFAIFFCQPLNAREIQLSASDDLTEQYSAIYSHDKIDNKKVSNLTIKNNTLIGDGFGIWLNQADNAIVSHSRIKGNLALRSVDRGNGIQISNVTNSHVFHNEVSETRDGVYVISSKNNIIEQNTMHH